MKVTSLIKLKNELLPVEVEVVLLPGLPQLHFLGLPDQIIKESVLRIKSAIKSQGFEFPRAQQIIVNIRPNHLKKSSRGLELAVAAGILWETQQLPAPLSNQDFVVYGELGLQGEIYEPEDLALDFYNKDIQVLTGAGNSKADFIRLRAKSLQDLTTPRAQTMDQLHFENKRPALTGITDVPKSQGRLLEILATGEHTFLLAGPQGSGKSTIAKTLNTLLRAPSDQEIQEVQRIKKSKIETTFWRSFISPHHSITLKALTGGGVPLYHGQITEAHRGVLLFDELLEFSRPALEALREPLESGVISLARGSEKSNFPARFLFGATTNLCPCGKWTPQEKRFYCQYSLKKCTSYLEKLSGPMLDRFHILYFTNTNVEDRMPLNQVLTKIELAQKFSLETFGDFEFPKRWSEDQLLKQVDWYYWKTHMPVHTSSQRRVISTLRVARTLADLEQSKGIKNKHLEEALQYTFKPFERLKSVRG